MEKIIIYPEHAGYSEVFKPYGAQDDVPDDIPDDVPSIVDQIWQAGPIQAALKRASGASIVLDLPLPPADDVDSDGEFYKAPKIVQGVTAALRKTGDAAFVRVLAKIRSVFDGHPEEYEEAVQLVTKIRAEARNEAIAQI